MAETLNLPSIDLSSTDRISTAKLIGEACMEHGFFYLVNHGIRDEVFKQVFEESRKFFVLPLQEKMKLEHNNEQHAGYTPLYAETLDPSVKSKGDLKESFYIAALENSNQWPPGALNLEDGFFEKLGAPVGFLRLLHYPVAGEFTVSDTETYGASAHSDYGMLTLLATDGVRGLQICREKDKQPQVWEDVHHVNGAFIVNIGDMLERWTNCLFRSTLHRVMPTGQERYSVAFFVDPNLECVVECLESCCSETCPPRFPPIRSGDYLQERLRATYF